MPDISVNPMKYLSMAAAPVLRSARQQLKLRDADLKPIAFSGVDKEMSAAIEILARSGATAGQAIAEFLKGKIADPPDVFREHPVPQWMATETTHGLIKRAVEALIRDENTDVQAYADDAAAFFADFDGADGPGRGLAAFEYAVAYVALSVANELDLGTRMVLSAVARVDERVDRALRRQPVALLDRFIEDSLAAQAQRRFFEGSDHKEEIRRLAARVTGGGDLSAASDKVRARVLAMAARYLSREPDPQDAKDYLAASLQLADTEDALVASAQIAAVLAPSVGLSRLNPIDTPLKRLAAISIVHNRDGPGKFLDWFDATGFEWSMLDSDGRHVLLAARIEAGQWDRAYADAKKVTPADILATPAIGHVAALALAAQSVPSDLRGLIVTGPPFDPLGFPLSDTPNALSERREAITMSSQTMRAAEAMGLHDVASAIATFVLWLELRDPDTRDDARSRLRQELEGRDALRWVPLGLAFGVELDRLRIEEAINRAAALDPAGTVDMALARLALGVAKPSPAETAGYLADHRDILFAHLNPAAIADLEVKALITAGRPGEAERRLAELGDLLEDRQIEHLQSVIASGGDGPSVADLEALYAADASTSNLAQLVMALSNQGYSERLLLLARRLLAVTSSVQIAINLVRLLSSEERVEELAHVLSDIPLLIGQSLELRAAQAWNAYTRGDLKLAAQVLGGLRGERDVPDDRALQVNILLVSGRWEELSRHVEEEWAKRNDRTPEELLDLAQLAGEVKSARVKDFIALAADRAPTDAVILSRAYFQSVQAGLEQNADVHRWLDAAARLSGDDGPIQSADLAEVAAGQQDWERRTADVWAKLKAGDMPLHIGAKLLNRPNLELRLAPMLANLDEPDPRRRAVIPAFSGQRETSLRSGTALGIGASALVTWGVLDLVQKVVERGGLKIPHSTLGWLFQERQRLAFHQPSRIDFARQLERGLSTSRLFKFTPSVAVDGRLIDKIGRELAGMILTAQAERQDDVPRMVVRSAPVERIGSFSGEKVDLSQYAAALCSCQAVIDWLAAAGQLTADEERHARTYLEAFEERWPDEPAIQAGSEVYLDDLSVSFLNTVGVLERLNASGLKVYISERQIQEANALLDLERLSIEIERVIEQIRLPLAAGIEEGRVALGRLASPRDELRQHPDLAAVELAGDVDAVVTDDRYVNRVFRIDGKNGSAQTWTSLDLLAVMREEGLLDDASELRHRTTLRRAGLVMFPSSGDELAKYIDRTSVRDGRLIETGELRAFRENLQLTQMRGWLAMPAEATWLQTLSRHLVETICRQWHPDIADDVARARSRWLLDRADLRNWAGSLASDDGSLIESHGQAIPITDLLIRRADIPADAHDRFDAWLTEEVLDPLKFQAPDVHAWILGAARMIILSIGKD